MSVVETKQLDSQTSTSRGRGSFAASNNVRGSVSTGSRSRGSVAVGSRSRGSVAVGSGGGGTSLFHHKSKTHDEDDDRENEEDDELEGRTFVVFSYLFLSEPKSSRYAIFWSYLLCTLALAHVLALCMETCDGPNQYEGRQDFSRFSFLPSAKTYRAAEMGCLIPLVVDSAIRLILLLLVFLDPKNSSIAARLQRDHFTFILFLVDIVSVGPFLYEAFYLKPALTVAYLSQDRRVMLRIVDLMVTGRVLRAIKDVPAFWAIRMALSRAIPHLVLPIFFFVIFNMFVAVILYFLEPCYNYNFCPWADLFSATFFSVVAMTTTGYGTQVPQYALGRALVIVVMFFGAVFLSMPLAIIGNEYEDAWNEASNREWRRDQKSLGLGLGLEVAASDDNTVKPEAEAEGKGGVVGNGESDKEDKEKAEEDDEALVHKIHQERRAANCPLIKSHLRLIELVDRCQAELEAHTRVTPFLLLSFSSIKYSLKSLVGHLTEAIEMVESPRNTAGNEIVDLLKKRRLSRRMVSLSRFANSNNALDSIKQTADELGQIFAFSFTKKEIYELFVNTRRAIASFFSIPYLGGYKPLSYKALTTLRQTQALDKKNWRARLWVLLEQSDSSRQSRLSQLILIGMISLSIIILYTETFISFSHYGENSRVCEKVLVEYCSDKFDYFSDPGCFAQVPTPPGETPPKLNFFCESTEDPLCFAMGSNFGAPYSNLTCGSDVSPFQDLQSLLAKYGDPTFFTLHDNFHKFNDVCQRIECRNSHQLVDGKNLWLRAELTFTIFFIVEVFARLIASETLYAYLSDPMNWIDVMPIIPFFADLALADGDVSKLDFSIIASAPGPIILVLLRSLKVLRLIKLTRSFKAAQILNETFYRVGSQLIAVLSLLTGVVVLFSIVLYEMERGKKCFANSTTCVPVNVPPTFYVTPGSVAYINKNGVLSQFSNALYAIWFSFVTVTSTGFGDVLPVTNGGMILAAFLMLAGSCYLSMPLTAVATVFQETFDKHNERNRRSDVLRKHIRREKEANNWKVDVLQMERLVNIKKLLIENDVKVSDFFVLLTKPASALPPPNSAQHDKSVGKKPEPSELHDKVEELVKALRKLLNASATDIQALSLVLIKLRDKIKEIMDERESDEI